MYTSIRTYRGLNESLHLKVQNKRSYSHLEGILICLIESPYEKEGKSGNRAGGSRDERASMKAPPKKEGKLSIST